MPRINYSKVFQAPNLKQEDLTSQVNGSETIFTTAGSFLPEQVFIYVNGVLQRLGVEASVLVLASSCPSLVSGTLVLYCISFFLPFSCFLFFLFECFEICCCNFLTRVCNRSKFFLFSTILFVRHNVLLYFRGARLDRFAPSKSFCNCL